MVYYILYSQNAFINEVYSLRYSSWCDVSSDRFIMVDRLNYFSLESVLHDGYNNKGRGMCYPGVYKISPAANRKA